VNGDDLRLSVNGKTTTFTVGVPAQEFGGIHTARALRVPDDVVAQRYGTRGADGNATLPTGSELLHRPYITAATRRALPGFNHFDDPAPYPVRAVRLNGRDLLLFGGPSRIFAYDTFPQTVTVLEAGRVIGVPEVEAGSVLVDYGDEMAAAANVAH